jgi:hypothetical protein
MERFRNPHGSAVGFSSLTFGRDTALNVIGDDKPNIVYQLGDHDPSGVVAWNAFENGLRSHPNGEDVTFTRLAVEREFEHIQNWYRNERFAADPNQRDLITNYRTPGQGTGGRVVAGESWRASREVQALSPRPSAGTSG